MAQKFLFAVLLIGMLKVDNSDSWKMPDGYNPEDTDPDDPESMYPPCGVVTCGIPCPEAALPRPRCPENATLCRSGCACVFFCDERGTQYCFNTRQCLHRRRSFLQGKHYRRAHTATATVKGGTSTVTAANVDKE